MFCCVTSKQQFSPVAFSEEKGSHRQHFRCAGVWCCFGRHFFYGRNSPSFRILSWTSLADVGKVSCRVVSIYT